MRFNMKRTTLPQFTMSATTVTSQLVNSMRNVGLKRTLENAAVLLEDFWFDKRLGITTSGIVELDGLEIHSANKALGVRYEPTRVRAFRKMLGRLSLPENSVFVDFGCGKGRILCAAAAFPFKRIVGIEFSPDLCRACEENIRSFKLAKQICPEIHVVEKDAVHYSIEKAANVFFFSNPFHEHIMELIMENLHATIKAHPRKAVLIICNPDQLAKVVDASSIFFHAWTYTYGSSCFRIYSTTLPAEREFRR